MLYFFLSFFLSIVFTLFVRRLAKRLKIVDTPDKTRHLHSNPVPLLGGAAIFLAFWLVTACVLFCHPIYGIEILKTKLIWAFAASTIIIIIGTLDDRKPMSVKVRLAVTAAAALVAVVGGVGLQKITNPFGGFIQISLVVGNVLVFLWLMGMMYTTKILDGLDGLATGVVAIGAIMIFFLTRTAKFYQPNVGLLALIFAGACLGFLLFNFHPAKIFLGEGGSLLTGFILGILAVISGGKLAIALLVMAVPILDLARVIYMRLRYGRSIFQGDREHLHFQLLTYGLSERQAVILFYFISALFGAAALFLQSTQKLLALLFLILAMVAVGWKMGKK